MTIDTDLLWVVGVILALSALYCGMMSAPRNQRAGANLRQAGGRAGVAKSKPIVRLLVASQVRIVAASSAVGVIKADAGVSRGGSPSLSVGDQVSRLSAIVTTAIDGARDADRLHRAANEQLDAAHYALQNLLHDLSAVMSITAPSVQRVETAVTQLRASSLPVFETALAA
jgi:hypothetical protein